MYFHYESGYDPRDLVAQFRQEKRVAKAIGLTQRRHFLGLMENLVSHFYGISNVDESVTLSRTVMSMNVIKMQMSNEARNILSHWNDHDPPRAPPRTKPPTRKVYKYQCSICKKQYNNLSNHWRHAHKLTKREVQELKSEKNRGKAKGDQEKNQKKRPIRCCPLPGCSWVGRRFDYHLPKVHNMAKDSEKYLSLVRRGVSTKSLPL